MMNRSFHCLPIIALAACWLGVVLPASAQTATWKVTGIGLWSDEANWTASGTPPGATPPDATTTAIISNGGTARIINGSAFTNPLSMGSGRLEITRDNSAAVLTSSGAVTVGTAAAMASVLVDGEGSEWIKTSNGQFQIGTNGNGTMTISNSGKVTVASVMHIGLGSSTGATGEGVVNVQTSGQYVMSGTFILGYRGKGTLNVESGGYVKSTNGFIGGYGPDTNRVQGTGIANITGAGSRWETAALYVGHTGTGILTIENGGLLVNTSSSIIGHLNNGAPAGGGVAPPSKYGTGTVTVRSNGTWQSTQDIQVGSYGTGTLNIASQGKVQIGSAAKKVTLGGNEAASGRLNIGGDPLAETPLAEAPGVLNGSLVTTGNGTGTKAVSFFHTDDTGAYYFTNTGGSAGTHITLSGALELNALAGATTLKGANTFTGGTIIGGDATSTAELIAAHGQALSSGPVVVRDKGVLTVAPTVALLTVGDLTLAGGGGIKLQADATGGNAPRIDAADLTVQADVDSKFTIYLEGTEEITTDLGLYEWTFLTSDSLSGYEPDAFVVVADVPGFYVFQRDNSLVIGSIVPEPGRACLLLGGLLALALRRRRAVQR